MSSVKINVTLLGRSDLAILVTDGRTQVWVPISEIEEEIEEPGKMGLLITTAIILPDWLAREKGLQQVNHDVDTLDMFGGGG